MLPFSELAQVMAAVLILAMGAVALCWSPWRRPWRERTAIWFGVTACLYGVRLLSQSALIRPFGPEPLWRFLETSVTYAIFIPIGCFVDSLFGPGWKSVFRRIWQVGLVYAPLSMAWDLATHPGAALWLNKPLVIGVGGVMVVHLVVYWRREKPTRAFRIAVGGGLVFLGVAAYQTLGGRHQVEPFAMLLFMGAVGYLVAHRMLEGERRLVVVSKELELARRIQTSILPRMIPELPGLSLAAGYYPCTEIGGDFYDFEVLEGGGLALIVADVSGHGVPAALVASMVKIAFAAEAPGMRQPGQALARINRILCGKFSGAFVTACCAYVDAPAGILRFACAGHPGPVLQRGGGAVERLQVGGLLLAFSPQATFEAAEVRIAAGDRLVFFSDGLTEASDPRDAFFGERAFPDLLPACRSMTPEAFRDRVITSLRAWIAPRAQLQDDVTLVVVDVG